MDLVRSLGADAIIDYTKDDFTQLDERYDLIVVFGGGSWSHAYGERSPPRGPSSSQEAKVAASGWVVEAG